MQKNYVFTGGLHDENSGGHLCEAECCLAVYPASEVDARIAELEKALQNIRAFIVKVNEGMEMGGIDSQIVADIDLALMET